MNDQSRRKAPFYRFSNSRTVRHVMDNWSIKIILGSLFLSLLVACSLIGPYFATQNYYETNLTIKNLPPSALHWFGTDELGRSVFARVMYGSRISLFIGIISALLDTCIGIIVGAIAGFYGGSIDTVIMRFVDILHSLPRLITVILLMVVLGQGVFTIILAITLTGWINMTRIVRSHIIALKEEQFVISAKLLGASTKRILYTHLIPNTAGLIISTLILTVPTAIFAEAYLSFLGLGVPAPEASWGTMASDALNSFRHYPWRLFFPSLFITVTLLSFHLLGEGIKNAYSSQRNYSEGK